MLTILGGLSLVALASSAQQTSAPDPRAGTWTLVSAQASLQPANTLSIVAVHDAVHVVMTGETRLDFTAKADGKDAPVVGNPAFDQVGLHRTDKRQVELTEKKNGTVVGGLRSKVSQDGKELTITSVRTGRPDELTVWTRTGGAKAIGDALAGNWTEDLGKTRLRQGLTVRIEPDGSGGVRYTGGFSYTARFDGKRYDVKNSRNDTVVLAQVDPHTVEATYRRDEQVTQKDRAVISADNRQMTVTSTGTLETGQKVAETLVFKKQ